MTIYEFIKINKNVLQTRADGADGYWMDNRIFAREQADIEYVTLCKVLNESRTMQGLILCGVDLEE